MKQKNLGDTAEKNLQEKAKELIERTLFDNDVDFAQPSPTVIWWDRGGYLEPVVREAAKNMDIGFVKAEKTPLELRKEGFNGEPEVWYVPQAKEGRDWFEDVDNIGGELEYAVHELAAELYDDLLAVDLCEPDNYDQLDKIGEVLVEELTGSSLPTSDKLFSKVYTRERDPVDRVLKRGWKGIESDDRKQKIVEALSENIDVVSSSDDSDLALMKTKKWFVAKWLVEEGLDKDILPEEYSGLDQLEVKNKLKTLLEANSGLVTYIEDYWADVIDKADIWDLKKCPVEGSLEKKLWKNWKKLIENENYEEARGKASDRHEVLQKYYGKSFDLVKVWEISKTIASLAFQINSWEDVSGEDIFEKYSAENGLWKIDRAARKLQGLSNPSLKIGHLAEETLGELRSEWIGQYKDYLSDLAEYTEKQINDSSLFKEHRHAFQFWEDNEGELESKGSKAIFYIDALRFDLAKELAEGIRDLDDFEVEEKPRIGCLPSITRFGMNTLIPGDSRSFSLKLKDKLQPYKNNAKITAKKRKRELRLKGWHEATEKYNGDWSHPRTYIFDQELDEYGEEDLDDIENKVNQRLKTLKKLIKEKIVAGGYDEAFIITDHGFMLMPEDYTAEGISSPDKAADVSRRWCSGKDLEPKTGLEFDKDNLNYLENPIILLVDPYQRYKKQGISDKRYFHGGGMPQEFILDFIKVEKE